ncbi:MAG: type II secretion system protein [Candidatus Shapirobacteria bacterium]|jgi:type II secretory pathway pseudopilin PulG
MMPTKRLTAGFTLIEMILYIGIVTIFLTAAIQFGWNIIYIRVKSTNQQELNQNLRLVAEKLLYEIRNAQSINTLTSTSLTLNSVDPQRHPTKIDLTNGSVRFGYGPSGSCSFSAPCNLTGNLVRITNLTFSDLSSNDGKSVNISFSLTGEVINPSGRQEYVYSQTHTGSAELRLK